MSKTTDLTELAEVPATGDFIPIVDVSDTTHAATGTTKRVSRSNLLGYTEYIALLTQTGTDAPTATVVKNDTGATVTLGYISAGVYTLTFSSEVLTANKTVGLCNINLATLYTYVVQITSTTVVTVSTRNVGNTLANGLLTSTPIIIRVYV